ncbi:IS66-like element accessory protein TnpA [Ruegeria sp.]|uniref:IS66-like element accessory protein TnpA n=1 Tax=Ruegeria sp. TaxID=1879320 RepID=UPI003B00006F
MTEFLRSLGVEYQVDGRRRWSHDAKAYIVAETLKPGATVKAVAGKFGVNANRLSEWRCLAKDGKLVLPAPEPDEHVEFAPVVLCDGDEASVQPQVRPPSSPAEKVEIVFRGVSINLGTDTSAQRIAEIARAVGVVE